MVQTDKPNFSRTVGNLPGDDEAERGYRQRLADMLKGHDRITVAAALSEELSVCVSASFLNECTRGMTGGRGARFPAAWIPALEKILGMYDLSRSLRCEESRLCEDIGVAVAGNGWLRERLRKLLADMEAAEQRAVKANRARAKKGKRESR